MSIMGNQATPTPIQISKSQTLADQTVVAQSQDLIPVIRAAIIVQAIATSQEPLETPGHPDRMVLARSVVSAPDLFISQVASLVAAQGLDASSPDDSILSAVAAVWDLVAGV